VPHDVMVKLRNVTLEGLYKRGCRSATFRDFLDRPVKGLLWPGCPLDTGFRVEFRSRRGVVRAELLHARENSLRKGVAEDAQLAEIQSNSSMRTYPRVTTQQVEDATKLALEDEDEKKRRLEQEKVEKEEAEKKEAEARKELEALMQAQAEEVEIIRWTLANGEAAPAAPRNPVLDAGSDDDDTRQTIKEKNQVRRRGPANPATMMALGKGFSGMVKVEAGGMLAMKEECLWCRIRCVGFVLYAFSVSVRGVPCGSAHGETSQMSSKSLRPECHCAMWASLRSNSVVT
jgi:regulator of replication initiation timing